MRRMMLLAGAALLLAGQPAWLLAQGQGKGGGGGGHGAERGGGGGKDDRGGRGNGGGGGGRGQEMRGHEMRGQGGDRGPGRAMREDRGPRMERASRDDRGRGRGRDDTVGRVDRSRGKGQDDASVRLRGPVSANRQAVVVDRGDADRIFIGGRERARAAFVPGCPPGLAKKNNGCLPPGQARKIYGDPLFRYSPLYGAAGLGDLFYQNGYAYRMDPGSGLVNAFMPLLGGALYPGNTWPSAYTDYALDPYYGRYYGYDPVYDYRYANDALFAVDPRTQRIDGIAALLAGDPWAVGRPMPLGYDMYNVPPAYRDRYYDGPNDWYRYSDGYIYRVDPTTQLVSAIIELLV